MADEVYPRIKVLYFADTFQVQVEEYKNEEQDLFVLLMSGQPRVYIPKKAADKIARFILFADERE